MLPVALLLPGCSLLTDLLSGRASEPPPAQGDLPAIAAPEESPSGRKPRSRGGRGGGGGDAAVPSDLVTIEVEAPGTGGRRNAFVRVPETPGPWPVIFAFHGGKDNNGLDMVPKLRGAEREGILLVYPSSNTTSPWWTGPDKNNGDPLQDVKFVRALVEQVDEQYDIDRNRMYAVGISGGGYMTDWLWCEAPDLFHGFMVVSRAMPTEMSQQCRADPPRPMMLILGTADDGLADHQLPIPDTLDFYRDRLGCKANKKQSREVPDRGDTLTVRHDTWKDCAKGGAFEYFEVVGGGHNWPGSGRSKPDKTVDIDATEEMLRFFREHAGL